MSSAELLIGQHIEQYEIRRHIARGGMADVYLAYDDALRRRVALKIMLPALAADDQYVNRFRREAQTAARLDHPNIIHIYSIGQLKDGRPYIAMQYVEGGTLRDTLVKLSSEGRLVETNQSLSIIGKMADALQVAHQAGIMHRDIKPSNILIRPDGRPVLVDLGIAAVEGSPKITHTGTLIGTPHYMSPEQATGKRVDPRSDIYSLGVILYELLAGRRPFEAEDAMAVLHQHIYEQPPPLENFRPDLAPETVYLVHRCLRKEPEQRFQTAAELSKAINLVIKKEGGPGVVTQIDGWVPYPTDEYRLSESKIKQATPSPQPAPGAGSRRWPLILVPLLLLLLGFGAFYFLDPLNTFGSEPDNGDPMAVIEGSDDTPSPGSVQTEASGAVEESVASSPTEIVVTEESQADAVIDPQDNDSQPTETTPTDTPAPTATVEPTITSEPTPEATQTPDLGPETSVIGQSVLGTPIRVVRFGRGDNILLFVGGLHAGSAPSTVALARRAIDHFTTNPEEIPASAALIIIPNANPDSPRAPGELNGRLNANGVDLNRNWDCRWTEDASWRGNIVPGSGGPEPFSEPETRALAEFILDNSPAAVVFWEARASDGLSSPGTCTTRPRVSEPAAEVYGQAAGYPVADFEDLTSQVLNGDGTNWIDDQGIPAVAVLLPEYEEIDWSNNLAGIRAMLEVFGK